MSFKKIKGFKNYSINEKGQVRNDITKKIKKPFVNKKNSYFTIDLWENNKGTKKTIHRLIAENFIPNPFNKPTVDHIDGNRQNNAINNLRWATYSEQNSRFGTNGVRSEKILVTKYEELMGACGKRDINWGGILDQKVFNSISEVAKYFNLTLSNISLLLKNKGIGRRGKTRGYKFEYLNRTRKTHKK